MIKYPLDRTAWLPLQAVLAVKLTSHKLNTRYFRLGSLQDRFYLEFRNAHTCVRHASNQVCIDFSKACNMFERFKHIL